MTASAVATQQGIAMALRQSGSTGRHRKKAHAPGWNMPRQRTTSHTPRHRKDTPAATTRTPPRHRKKGRGNGQAVYPYFGIRQGNSIGTATRRVALPSALALGVLAVGGAITGAFSAPPLDANRTDSSGLGPMPAPPALTAESTHSSGVVALPPIADRGVRPSIDTSGPAWPIIEQAATDERNDDDGSAEQDQNGTTTTTIRDRARGPGAFAPSVTAEPPASPGGGGGPAESAVPPERPVVGGGPLSGVFGPGGLLDGLADGPVDGGSDTHPGRVDRPGGSRDTRGHGGADGGFGSPGKRGNAGGSGDGSGDGRSGGGGQHRRGGGRH